MSDQLKRHTLDGDWQEWNRFWDSGLDAEDETLYTPDTPRTLLQLWQRCYFEDLWALMGNRATTCSYLELGSGRATTSMYVAAHGAGSVTLVDRAPNALALAQRNFERSGLGEPRLVMADAAQTGLPANSYDCIYNIGLLEHFEDPEPVLRETWRLLRPGGLVFMVIVPRIPFTRSLAMRFRLHPINALWFSARATAKWLLKRHQGSGFTRTAGAPSYYVRMMRNLGCLEVQCLPYNPYHPVGDNTDREVNRTVPFYWRHYLRTARRRHRPVLRTARWKALCDLLLARKPNADAAVQ